jgi:hypothetical protein
MSYNILISKLFGGRYMNSSESASPYRFNFKVVLVGDPESTQKFIEQMGEQKKITLDGQIISLVFDDGNDNRYKHFMGANAAVCIYDTTNSRESFNDNIKQYLSVINRHTENV